MARHHIRKGLAKTKRTTLTTADTAKASKPDSLAVAAGPSTSFEDFESLPRSAKLVEIDRQVKMAKTSTASLGKYDSKLKGEPAREKGQKRKFQSNEMDSVKEKDRYLSVLESLNNDEKVAKRRRGESETSGIVNARKAIRSASKGKGSASLAGAEKKSKFIKKSGLSRPGKGSPASIKGRKGGKTQGAVSKGRRKS